MRPNHITAPTPKPHGNTTHGMSQTKEYSHWKTMIRRCCSPTNPKYSDYGGRGISVCQEWRNDFVAFFNHIGPMPFENATIDRIDNDGNYEPGNVRWANAFQQSRNKRNSRLLGFRGETLTMTEWASKLGLSVQTIKSRLDQLGWSVERTLATRYDARTAHTSHKRDCDGKFAK